MEVERLAARHDGGSLMSIDPYNTSGFGNGADRTSTAGFNVGTSCGFVDSFVEFELVRGASTFCRATLLGSGALRRFVTTSGDADLLDVFSVATNFAGVAGAA